MTIVLMTIVTFARPISEADFFNKLVHEKICVNIRTSLMRNRTSVQTNLYDQCVKWANESWVAKN